MSKVDSLLSQMMKAHEPSANALASMRAAVDVVTKNAASVDSSLLIAMIFRNAYQYLHENRREFDAADPVSCENSARLP